MVRAQVETVPHSGLLERIPRTRCCRKVLRAVVLGVAWLLNAGSGRETMVERVVGMTLGGTRRSLSETFIQRARCSQLVSVQIQMMALQVTYSLLQHFRTRQKPGTVRETRVVGKTLTERTIVW